MVGLYASSRLALICIYIHDVYILMQQLATHKPAHVCHCRSQSLA